MPNARSIGRRPDQLAFTTSVQGASPEMPPCSKRTRSPRRSRRTLFTRCARCRAMRGSATSAARSARAGIDSVLRGAKHRLEIARVEPVAVLLLLQLRKAAAHRETQIVAARGARALAVERRAALVVGGESIGAEQRPAMDAVVEGHG